MQRLARFADSRPGAFGLVVTVAFLVIVVAAGVVSYPVAGEAGQAVVSGTVMLLGAGALLLLLRSLGWLGSAWVTRAGDRSAWWRLSWVLVYLPVVTLAAFLPDTDRTLPHWESAVALAFQSLVSGGLLQEITFRALVLYALLHAWYRRPAGVFRALLASAVLFSAAHVLNLASGMGAGVVGLQILDTLLAGLYLGAFVIHAGSIWPAVVVHGLGNAVVTVVAAGTPDFADTPRAWLMLVALKAPVYFYAIYLARRSAAAASPGGDPRGREDAQWQAPSA